MMDSQNAPYEDIPLESRASLFNLVKSTPLAEILRKVNLDGHLQIIYQQVRGTRNITPLTLLLLCKAFEDWTPVELLFADLGLSIEVKTERRGQGSVMMEVIQASASIGELNKRLHNAMTDGKLNPTERAAIAQAAQLTIDELNDVIHACAQGAMA